MKYSELLQANVKIFLQHDVYIRIYLKKCFVYKYYMRGSGNVIQTVK